MRTSLIVLSCLLSLGALSTSHAESEFPLQLWWNESEQPKHYSYQECPGVSATGVVQKRFGFVTGTGAPVNARGVNLWNEYTIDELIDGLAREIARDLVRFREEGRDYTEKQLPDLCDVPGSTMVSTYWPEQYAPLGCTAAGGPVALSAGISASDVANDAHWWQVRSSEKSALWILPAADETYLCKALLETLAPLRELHSRNVLKKIRGTLNYDVTTDGRTFFSLSPGKSRDLMIAVVPSKTTDGHFGAMVAYTAHVGQRVDCVLSK